MTNVEKIIEVLKIAPGLDDDELKKATGIPHRETVNQDCRHLQSQGKLIRFRGPTGKLVNYLIGPYDSFDEGWRKATREEDEARTDAAWQAMKNRIAALETENRALRKRLGPRPPTT